MASEQSYKIFDKTKCRLGEGVIWHPKLNALFWFDIMSKMLHSNMNGVHKTWAFEEYVSAAAWIDEKNFLLSTESGLSEFNILTGAQEHIAEIEADNPITRSNDGRADKQHGFWVSTMGFDAVKDAGAIYRYYKGEVRKLHDRITIPNSICFSPDGQFAYFTDTPTKKIMRQPLDQTTGWPSADAVVHLDFSHRNDGPDGAVTDANGNIWIAFWGQGCVEGFDQAGTSIGKMDLPAKHTTCPAFGGENYNKVFVTSALQGLSEADASNDFQGVTYELELGFKGLPEPNVIV